MNQKNIFIGLGAVFLILITVFTVNHFNKSKKSEDNPFLTINPAEKIERLQVESEYEPDGMYAPDTVLGRFQKQMMPFKKLPLSAQFDLYRIKHEAYMKSLVSLKENFLIMHNFIDSKLGYPPLLPSVTEVFSIETPTDEVVEREYQRLKNTYPIKDPVMAKTQIAMDIKIKWHAESFFKKLKAAEEMNIFHIYLLPPKHPPLSFINKEDIATLGNDDAKYKLSIYTNYGCRRCRVLNLNVSDAIKVLGENLKIEQIVLGPQQRYAGNLLEMYMPNFMNCALKIDQSVYWKVHVDIIQNKALLEKMARPIDESRQMVDTLFQKYFKDKFKEWSFCAFDERNLKKVASLTEMVEKLLGFDLQPAYYLNERWLDIIQNGNITTSIKEAVKNPNWK